MIKEKQASLINAHRGVEHFIKQNRNNNSKYELFSTYAKALKPDSYYILEALEYADTNNWHDIFDLLIERATNKEWTELYKLKKRSQSLSIGEMEFQIKKINPKSDEMKIFSKLIMVYKTCDTTNFKLMNKYADSIDTEEMEDGFIKSSFRSRLLVLLANTFLFEGNLYAARYYASLAIIESNIDRFSAFGYLHIGNSYMLTDYKTAKDNFLSGLKFAKPGDNHYKQLIRSLSFLENYWENDHKYTDFQSGCTEDVHEQAFYWIKRNEHEKALNLLNGMDRSALSNGQLAFHYFYRGLISSDKSDFYNSIKYFKLSGDKFFVECPLRELNKLGEDRKIVDIFAI